MRRLLMVAMVLLGGAWPAWAQLVTFPSDRLDVVTQGGGRHSFTVEMAQTSEQLSQGLMFRRELPAGTGMLFDFARPRPVAMWMKNTLIPLDMLFVEASGRVIHVEEYAPPGSLEPRGPSEPVLGVLELPAGTARRLGIGPGSRVEHAMFRRGPQP